MRAAYRAPYDGLMHPVNDPNDPMTAMTLSLIRMCDDLSRSVDQAHQLRGVMERMPPEHARRATEPRVGPSYVDSLQQAIQCLAELSESYRALRTTILRRAAEPPASAERDQFQRDQAQQDE